MSGLHSGYSILSTREEFLVTSVASEGLPENLMLKRQIYGRVFPRGFF